MKISHCTFTGVDERTNLDLLSFLSVKYPFVEWGFLYSPKREGEPGRYPSVEFLQNAFRSLPSTTNVALHVCGKGVYDLIESEPVISSLVELVHARQGRVQLNFSHARKNVDLDKLKGMIELLYPMTIITQVHQANEGIWQALRELDNHAVLFDGSGGRGISPDIWPEPLPISCGYAGGLGPSNISDQLNIISNTVGNREIWIDMEGSLRTTDEHGHDWLELSRCEDVLSSIKNSDSDYV